MLAHLSMLCQGKLVENKLPLSLKRHEFYTKAGRAAVSEQQRPQGLLEE